MLRTFLCYGALCSVACGSADGTASSSGTASSGGSSSGTASSGGASSGGASSGGASSGAPVVPNECSPGSGPLATDVAGVHGITADFDFVYWTNEKTGSIAKVPRCGGPTTVLATGQPEPARIAVDDVAVYWTNAKDGTVCSVPKSGGTPTTLATGQVKPGAIHVDATSVYWMNWFGAQTTESLVKVAKAGGPPQVLATNPNDTKGWRDFALDASTLYFTDQGGAGRGSEGGIFTIPLAGGAVSKLPAVVGSATAIALDADHAYVATQGGAVYRVSLASNEAAVLAVNINNAGSIAVDADNVYWTNYLLRDGSLYSTPKNGDSIAPEELVKAEGSVRDLAVVGRSLYWTFDPNPAADAGTASTVMRRSR